MFDACVFQVQRPVHASLLDLDLTLEALACDPLNSSCLYAVRPTPPMATLFTAHAEVSGMDASADTHPPAQVNGTQFTVQHSSKTKVYEETVRNTFSHFGPVKSVLLPAKPGRRSRHAHIREYVRPWC